MKTSLTMLGIVSIAFLGSATAPACAQTSMGAIVSSVRDAAGHPVAGALVTAIGPANRDAVTNSAGIVTLLGLPPGRYTVRVTHAGFASYTQFVRLGSQADGVRNLNVLIAPVNFASAGGEFSSTVAAPTGSRNTPYVTASLTDSLTANILSSGSKAPFVIAGPALEGAGLNETRVELDGIPIAGGAANATSLRFRSALDLAGVSIVEGPGLSSPSLQNAIGGIVNYQTAPITARVSSSYAYGYDSVFDSFGHARFSDTFGGKVGVAVDTIGGQNGNDSAALKTRLDVSRATSIAVSSYADRATYTSGTTMISDVAPAYSADIRTTLGRSSLEGRVFESSSVTSDTNILTGTAATFSDPKQAWQTNGFTLDYSLPLGENALSFGYDRRVERYALGESPESLESIATLRLATDIQLARTSRLEIGDDVSTGNVVPHRNDPQIALAIHAGNAVALRFAAGSAYATVPQQLITAVTPDAAFAPETSFGYRASAEITTRAGDRVRLAAFDLRRYDDFASLAQARSNGLELGFVRQPQAGRIGVDAGIDFSRTYGFGEVQPYARYATAEQTLDGAQLEGDPFSKAHVALTYRIEAVEVHFGTTYLGANNLLSPNAVTLGNFSLLVPVDPLGNMRMGVENMFGAAASNPTIAPLYPPREFTLTLER